MAFGLSSMTMAEEAEYWRVRCLRAEDAVRSDDWNTTLAPFTLFETRCLRLLAKHGRVSLETFMVALYSGATACETDARTVRTLISRARAKMPKRRKITITAEYRFGWMVKNQQGLIEYLAELQERSKPRLVKSASDAEPRAADPAHHSQKG